MAHFATALTQKSISKRQKLLHKFNLNFLRVVVFHSFIFIFTFSHFILDNIVKYTLLICNNITDGQTGVVQASFSQQQTYRTIQRNLSRACEWIIVDIIRIAHINVASALLFQPLFICIKDKQMRKMVAITFQIRFRFLTTTKCVFSSDMVAVFNVAGKRYVINTIPTYALELKRILKKSEKREMLHHCYSQAYVYNTESAFMRKANMIT